MNADPPAEHNDDAARLVRECLEGSDEAQRALVDRYAGLCYSIAARILSGRDRSHIEDAVQEAFYAIFAKLDQWHGRNLPAWIGAVAARQAIDLRRRLQRTDAERPGLPESELPASTERHTRGELAELREAVTDARQRLSPRQQQVLDALLAGRTRGELARELGVSVRTIYYELNEIRRQLKESLEGLADPEDLERL